MEARDAVEESGLPRPVRADEADQLTLLDRKGDMVVRPQPPEVLGDGLQFQEGHYPLLLRRTLSTIPQMPLGSNAEMTMMMRP